MRAGYRCRLGFAVAAAGLFAMVLAGCGGGKKGADSNASLTSLTLSAGTLAPVFSTATTSYSAEVAFDVSSVTVTPTAESEKAAITVNGASVQSGVASQAISLTVGSNAIAVLVTAEDGATTRTYTVSVTQQACVPSSCSGRDCGSDGCGGTCGTCVSTTEGCNTTGQCVVPGTWTWVGISAGTFTMGSPDGSGVPAELGRGSDEVQHSVTLTHDFVMLSTEVTQKQYTDLMHVSNPSFFTLCGDNCPVEQVNWHEAAAYCNALSTAAGRENCYTCTGSGTAGVSCSPSYATPYECLGYRLPTEAEWEYAARAGTTTATYNGELIAVDCSPDTLNPIAWYSCNSGDNGGSVNARTHPVGTAGTDENLRKNDWGLYDMLGNVWEWCYDGYDIYETGDVTDPVGTGSLRVFRGGSWLIPVDGKGARVARAAKRSYGDPATARSGDVGLRPVRSLLP